MKTCTVSVALATYNGEKYIRQQLESICNQIRKPDEIVISDDGSSDHTLEIVAEVQRENPDIRFIVLTDNTYHGVFGNFEHALLQASGDYVFLCDQDDVWMTDKTLRVLEVFENHRDAMCVIHNATLIDKEGNKIDKEFSAIHLPFIPQDSDLVKLESQSYLESSVSSPLANGMLLCATKALVEKAFPVFWGGIFSMHDQWLEFCAICHNGCYYLNKQLTEYRIHGDNTTSSSANKRSIAGRIQSISRRIGKKTHKLSHNYALGSAFVRYLEYYGLDESDAYETAKIIIGIGNRQVNAAFSGRLGGMWKLIRLYQTSLRYRKAGRNEFLYELSEIFLVSPSERRRYVGEDLSYIKQPLLCLKDN